MYETYTRGWAKAIGRGQLHADYDASSAIAAAIAVAARCWSSRSAAALSYVAIEHPVLRLERHLAV